MLLLAGLSAEARVATFLLNLSTRMQERGYSATDFTLRMTREEIGSYLGMQLETVSRTLSRFQREGWIAFEGLPRLRQSLLTQLQRVDHRRHPRDRPRGPFFRTPLGMPAQRGADPLAGIGQRHSLLDGEAVDGDQPPPAT